MIARLSIDSLSFHVKIDYEVIARERLVSESCSESVEMFLGPGARNRQIISGRACILTAIGHRGNEN